MTRRMPSTLAALSVAGKQGMVRSVCSSASPTLQVRRNTVTRKTGFTTHKLNRVPANSFTLVKQVSGTTCQVQSKSLFLFNQPSSIPHRCWQTSQRTSHVIANWATPLACCRLRQSTIEMRIISMPLDLIRVADKFPNDRNTICRCAISMLYG